MSSQQSQVLGQSSLKLEASFVSPLACPIQGSQYKSKAFRVWEPRNRKGGVTLFHHHPTLAKWDWDIPCSENGSHAGHAEDAVSLFSREAVYAYLSLSPWATNQAWGIVESWGGVNAYLLSRPLPLRNLSPRNAEFLKAQMAMCRVDPFYIKNIDPGIRGGWTWNSRVWPKTWRTETWIGRFRNVWNPHKVPIHPQLWGEFQKVLKMYDVFN